MGNFDFKNKNVVILIKDTLLGGAERQALGVAKYLKENYNAQIEVVSIYSNDYNQDFYDFLNEAGLQKVHFFGPPSLAVTNTLSIRNLKKAIRASLYLQKISSEIKKMRPDIIIPYMNGPSKIAALIYRKTGAKYTFWHQLGLENYFRDWFEKRAVEFSPLFIANAENGLEVFREYYQVPENKLHVLPQYVAIQRENLAALKIKEEFSIDENAVVIGMIAHYRLEKYQELLLNAFLSLNRKTNVHLILLGNKSNSTESAEKYKNLEKIVCESGLQNKVSLLSEVSIHKILNILDIGVLVSQIEGTPNVVMEYMTYGLPVVATHHDGCKGLLGDSTFLIPNDEKILSAKLIELVNSKEKRMEEGNRNLKRIEYFSPENYFAKLTQILNKSRS
ncbi:glycosyltransferase [Flavobacterium amniphilum]|uniref:glycosyltransferase n=1 Tax=Flavobacterium amniphilum TaxID=1834035 RepID=UPI00202A7DF0|nr:glycosyltransferase [Flavobacterium amniphilum]MCL9805108.1 glycosyltransferase [Flavobacterium amniphilum]